MRADRFRCALGLALAAALIAAPGASAQAPAVAHRDLSYNLDAGPAPSPAEQGRLDVYAPADARRGSRPVVVYVHGGAWLTGDKANQITNKVNLFTGLGYVFVSVNYRLSPADLTTLDPGRVKHPAHAHDVGEALGWLRRNVARYGGDSNRMILMGHSAGAQLVSLVGADPRWAGAYGVRQRRILGVISLDTGAFDVAEHAGPNVRLRSRLIFWNAFGTPAENAASGSWRDASPLAFADASDPPFLLVSQNKPQRVAEHLAMANALAQPDAVLPANLSHAAINDAVGAPGDSSGVTPEVTAFIARVLRAPRTVIRAHPKRRVLTTRRRARVTFRFRAERWAARFECRIDGRPFSRCRSPRSYRLRAGKHRFLVRALSATGFRGPADGFSFRIRRVR